MTNLTHGESEQARKRRIGSLGMTGMAALLTIQPLLLMPLAAMADDGNYDNSGNGGYHNTINGTRGQIAAGTQVKVRLLSPISSSTAQVGDRFRVAVAGDDASGLPAGTVFYGQVSRVHPATPNSAGSVTLQLALPRGSYAYNHQDDSSDSYYNTGNTSGPYSSASSPNQSGNGSVPDNAPSANNAANGGGSSYYNPSYGYGSGNNSGSNAGSGPSYGNASNAVTIGNDASGTFSGRTPKSAGHAAPIAAAVGAILGFSRKRKLGDTVEGGVLGGVGGVAVDQSMKRGASDASFKVGDEIIVRLNRAMAVRTVVVPADEG